MHSASSSPSSWIARLACLSLLFAALSLANATTLSGTANLVATGNATFFVQSPTTFQQTSVDVTVQPYTAASLGATANNALTFLTSFTWNKAPASLSIRNGPCASTNPSTAFSNVTCSNSRCIASLPIANDAATALDVCVLFATGYYATSAPNVTMVFTVQTVATQFTASLTGASSTSRSVNIIAPQQNYVVNVNVDGSTVNYVNGGIAFLASGSNLASLPSGVMSIYEGACTLSLPATALATATCPTLQNVCATKFALGAVSSVRPLCAVFSLNAPYSSGSVSLAVRVSETKFTANMQTIGSTYSSPIVSVPSPVYGLPYQFDIQVPVYNLPASSLDSVVSTLVTPATSSHKFSQSLLSVQEGACGSSSSNPVFTTTCSFSSTCTSTATMSWGSSTTVTKAFCATITFNDQFLMMTNFSSSLQAFGTSGTLPAATTTSRLVSSVPALASNAGYNVQINVPAYAASISPIVNGPVMVSATYSIDSTTSGRTALNTSSITLYSGACVVGSKPGTVSSCKGNRLASDAVGAICAASVIASDAPTSTQQSFCAYIVCQTSTGCPAALLTSYLMTPSVVSTSATTFTQSTALGVYAFPTSPIQSTINSKFLDVSQSSGMAVMAASWTSSSSSPSVCTSSSALVPQLSGAPTLTRCTTSSAANIAQPIYFPPGGFVSTNTTSPYIFVLVSNILKDPVNSVSITWQASPLISTVPYMSQSGQLYLEFSSFSATYGHIVPSSYSPATPYVAIEVRYAPPAGVPTSGSGMQLSTTGLAMFDNIRPPIGTVFATQRSSVYPGTNSFVAVVNASQAWYFSAALFNSSLSASNALQSSAVFLPQANSTFPAPRTTPLNRYDVENISLHDGLLLEGIILAGLLALYSGYLSHRRYIGKPILWRDEANETALTNKARTDLFGCGTCCRSPTCAVAFFPFAVLDWLAGGQLRRSQIKAMAFTVFGLGLALLVIPLATSYTDGASSTVCGYCCDYGMSPISAANGFAEVSGKPMACFFPGNFNDGLYPYCMDNPLSPECDSAMQVKSQQACFFTTYSRVCVPRNNANVMLTMIGGLPLMFFGVLVFVTLGGTKKASDDHFIAEELKLL